MQLDTETAAAILKSSAQCNAVAEEATVRVVELMQEAIEYRERIAELENALDDIIMHGVERDHGWMMVPKVEWEQAIARANLKPRS